MKRIKIPILIIILLAILILPFQKIYGEEKKLNSLSIHVDDTTGEALFGVQFSIFQVDTSNDYYPSSTHDAKKHLIDSSKQSLITDSNGDVSFTDLNDGIYYVVENLGDIETAGFPNNPFLIELPHEDGDGNVKIQLKSQELYIDQFVNNADYADYDYAAINKAKHKPVFTDEKFGYTILSYFPEDIDASVGGHYVITDKIDKSITAYPDTLRVYVVPSMDTVVEKSYQIQEETHYEKSFDKDTNTLEVRITNEGMEFLGVRAEEYKDQYIKLMFDNHLDNSAVKGVDIYSYASVEYSIPKVQNRAVRLNPSDTGIKYRTLTAEVSENPEVHTGQFPLYKVDANNKTKYLEGAKFGIAESEKDARNGKFVQIKTTDKNGYILFSGLKYGEDGDNAKESSKLHDYWLVEIMAPKGYIKLSEPEKVKFNYIQHKNGENYIGDITVYNEQIKGVSSKNKNIVKTVLDKVKTGDVSSINILVGGLVLSVGVLLLIFRRRVISR